MLLEVTILWAEASQIDIFYLSDFEQFDVGSADKSQKLYAKDIRPCAYKDSIYG
jgi:hypothetical protein